MERGVLEPVAASVIIFFGALVAASIVSGLPMPQALARCPILVATIVPGIVVAVARLDILVESIADVLGKAIMTPPAPPIARPGRAMVVIPTALAAGASLCVAGVSLAMLVGMNPASAAMVVAGAMSLVAVSYPGASIKASAQSYARQLDRELPWFVMILETAYTAGRASIEYVLHLVSRADKVFVAFSKEARLLLRDYSNVFRSIIGTLALRSRVVGAQDYARFLSGLVAVMSESFGKVVDYLDAWIEESMRSAREKWEMYKTAFSTILSSSLMVVLMIPSITATFALLGTSPTSIILSIPLTAATVAFLVVMSRAVQPFERFRVRQSATIAGFAMFGASMVVLLSILGMRNMVGLVLGAWLATIPAMVMGEVEYSRMDRFEWDLVHLLRVFKDLVATRVPVPVAMRRLFRRARDFSKTTQRFMGEIMNAMSTFSSYEPALSSELCSRSFLARFFVYLAEVARRIGKITAPTLELICRYYLFVKTRNRDIARYSMFMIMMLYMAPIMIVFIPAVMYPQMEYYYHTLHAYQARGFSAPVTVANPRTVMEYAVAAATVIDFIVTVGASFVMTGLAFSVRAHAVGLATLGATIAIVSMVTGASPVAVLGW